MNTKVCVECRLLCTWHQLRSNPFNKSLCSVLMIPFQCDHTLGATDQFKIHLTNHQMTVSSEIGWYLTNGYQWMAKYEEIFSYYTPFSLSTNSNLIARITPGSPHGASASGGSSLSRLVPRSGADQDDFPTPFEGLASFQEQEPRLPTLGGFMSFLGKMIWTSQLEMLFKFDVS